MIFHTLQTYKCICDARGTSAKIGEKPQGFSPDRQTKQCRKKSKSGHKPVSNEVRNSFEAYVLAIAGLREGFVSLAQNKLYKENAKQQEPPHVRKNH